MEEPDILPGLARAMVENDANAAAVLWENSLPSRNYNSRVSGYEAAMSGMGLGWCIRAGEFIRRHWTPIPAQDFRLQPHYPHPAGGTTCAIVVPVYSALGQLIGCLLLFTNADLTGWSEKLPTSATVGRVEGATVMLRDAGDELMVAASFETLGKTDMARAIPSWVTVTQDNLANHFTPPDRIRTLYILHEGDEHEAAKSAARRLTELRPIGQQIYLLEPSTETLQPWWGD